MAIRTFDLNIEEVLENWEVEHGIREIIANALDEQVLSKSAAITIRKDERGDWHIRDYGRGLRIQHFTLNESDEKLNASSSIIGKFGVGLKDALATFHRRGIKLLLASPFGTYRLRPSQKHGFDNIVTLHIEYDDKPTNLQGTECVLRGVTDAQMDRAKSMFLEFANEDILETTLYGQIMRRQDTGGRVYILGVLANEEPNFLFSYNITSLTPGMKKLLTRERVNVNRTTYAERIRSILRAAASDSVHAMLVNQVEKRATGEQCDELAWIEIGQMALTLMHQRRRVAYLTEAELQNNPSILDNVKSDGYQVIVVTEQQKFKLQAQAASGGPEVRILESYVDEYNASFRYHFVEMEQLTPRERAVFDMTPKILTLVGLDSERLPAIRISETMRVIPDFTRGVWDRAVPAIIIKRSELASLAGFAATLLHEVAHATSGAVDATRAFEAVLTEYLGRTSAAAIHR